MAVSVGMRSVLRAAAALGVLALVFHLAHGELGLGGRSVDAFANDWVYDGVILGSAVACLARAWLVPQQRLAWLVFGLGFAADASGEIYYTLAFGDSGNPPTPSIADPLVLAVLPSDICRAGAARPRARRAI